MKSRRLKAGRRFFSNQVASLVLLATLTFFLFSIPLSSPQESSAQDDMTTPEVEPNDDVEQAQVLPLLADGQTITVTGDISLDDPGLFVEELETRFQINRPLRDFYVVPFGDGPSKQGMPGPVQLTITETAENPASDVDVFMLARVPDVFFFDEFKFLDLTGFSAENPKVIGPRVYYPVFAPTIEEGADARAFIGLSLRFDPTNYTLQVDRGVAESEKHILDDGDPDTGTLQDGRIVVNCFTPTRFPGQLVSVAAQFLPFQNQPDPVGQQIRLLVFTGPEGSNAPPANPTLLVDQMVTIPDVIQSVGQDIAFSIDPPVSIDSGNVYVGFQIPSPADGVGLLFDISGAQALRSFASDDGGQTWGVLQVEEDLSLETVVLNASIRATVEFAAGAARSLRRLARGRPIKPASVTEGHLILQPVNRQPEVP